MVTVPPENREAPADALPLETADRLA